MNPQRRLPSLNALRALEAVRETGSVSAAARRLSVSHSAVSHQIKHLEEWIGRPITVRRGRTVALTEAGESLARVVNTSFDAIRHEIDLLPLRFVRAVSISALPVIAEEVLLPHLKAFRRAHPAISLHLSLAQADRPKTPLPDIEVLFRHKTRLSPGDALFLPGEAVPVCSPTLLAAAGGDPREAIRSGPFLLDEDTRMWSDLLPKLGIAAGAEEHVPTIHLEGSFLLQKAAEEGVGIAICRRATTRRAVARGALVELSNVAIDQDWSYTLRISPQREIEPEVKLVADWLLSIAHATVAADVDAGGVPDRCGPHAADG
ncbi:MAG: LysR family transcriptional regulator [Pseudomonadota bacterium]